MQKTINNIIFENKQEYFSILQTTEILIRYLQDNASDNIDMQIKELNFIRDNAFIGLLRNGLKYVLITEQTPNLLRLTIDNVNYDCNSEDLQKILKNEYEKITGLKYTLKNKDDKNEDTESPETLNDEIISQTNAEVNEKQIFDKNAISNDGEVQEEKSVHIKEKEEILIQNNELSEQLPEQSTNKKTEKDKTTNDKKNNQEKNNKNINVSIHKPIIYNSLQEAGFCNKNTINKFEKEQSSKNVPEEKQQKKKKTYETKKNLTSFIFDDYILKINVPNKKIINEQIYVLPLQLEKNTSFAKFMVIIPKSEKHIYISDKYGNTHIVISGIEVLIKGSFANGRFNTFIVPDGQSSNDGVAIEKTGKEHQSKDIERLNNSVIYYKYKDFNVYVYPLSFENNATENANVDMVFEKNGEYQYFHEVGDKIFEITLNGKKYTPINYWKNNILYSEIF